MADRNAANVLPDPVGAATKTCSPAASAGQARTCASVGASKVRENHAATAGWNELSTLMNFSRRGRLIVSGRDGKSPQGGLAVLVLGAIGPIVVPLLYFTKKTC